MYMLEIFLVSQKNRRCTCRLEQLSTGKLFLDFLLHIRSLFQDKVIPFQLNHTREVRYVVVQFQVVLDSSRCTVS